MNINLLFHISPIMICHVYDFYFMISDILVCKFNIVKLVILVALLVKKKKQGKNRPPQLDVYQVSTSSYVDLSV